MGGWRRLVVFDDHWTLDWWIGYNFSFDLGIYLLVFHCWTNSSNAHILWICQWEGYVKATYNTSRCVILPERVVPNSPKVSCTPSLCFEVSRTHNTWSNPSKLGKEFVFSFRSRARQRRAFCCPRETRWTCHRSKKNVWEGRASLRRCSRQKRILSCMVVLGSCEFGAKFLTWSGGQCWKPRSEWRRVKKLSVKFCTNITINFHFLLDINTKDALSSLQQRRASPLWSNIFLTLATNSCSFS